MSPNERRAFGSYCGVAPPPRRKSPRRRRRSFDGCYEYDTYSRPRRGGAKKWDDFCDDDIHYYKCFDDFDMCDDMNAYDWNCGLGGGGVGLGSGNLLAPGQGYYAPGGLLAPNSGLQLNQNAGFFNGLNGANLFNNPLFGGGMQLNDLCQYMLYPPPNLNAHPNNNFLRWFHCNRRLKDFMCRNERQIRNDPNCLIKFIRLCFSQYANAIGPMALQNGIINTNNWRFANWNPHMYHHQLVGNAQVPFGQQQVVPEWQGAQARAAAGGRTGGAVNANIAAGGTGIGVGGDALTGARFVNVATRGQDAPAAGDLPTT